MKHLVSYSLLLICVLFCQTLINAQEVGQKIIVEHFTNTRCGICASRNPAFYTALQQKPNILHIAYHPSSPYSLCLFSTQNKEENDARTKFYNVYGGTPTFTINGELKSSNEVQNVSVYTPYENKTTPIKASLKLTRFSMDSISVEVTVSAVAPHSLGNLQLYVPLVEKVVYYNAPNGENTHYDVFRKSFTGLNSISFTAPKNNEAPFIYTASTSIKEFWQINQLYAMALVQQSNKAFVQTEVSPLLNADIISSNNQDALANKSAILFPNPAKEFVFIKSEGMDNFKEIYFYDIYGRVVLTPDLINIQSGISTSTLFQGTYYIKIKRNNDKVEVLKFVKQ
jgi:hypothetical protein